MICDNCEGEMYIDEWNGWRWACVNCGNEGELATDEEIKENE